MTLLSTLIAILIGVLSPLEWTLGYSSDKDVQPEKFVPATVPGACQLDIAAAENYPDYKFSDNYKQFSWMEDVYFTYRTSFATPSFGKDEQVWFCSKGIDYEFEISLNGEKLLYQEGMFRRVEIDITKYLKKEGNTLEVLIYKAPKHHDSPADRTQAAYSAKPPVGYEWDWHPRLIPCGIYDETGLEIRKSSHISCCKLTYDLSEDFSSAEVNLDAKIANPKGTTLEWTLLDMEGKEVTKISSDEASLKTVVSNPQLWWCHDQGTPYLYSYTLNLKDKKGKVLDTKEGKIGFRRIRLVMNEGTWTEVKGFPQSRSNPPAQFELNGRMIFAKGTNWLAPDIFIGRITKDTYEPLIDYAVKANMNIFRCWGGCAVSKDSFFELCDEKGILVWQEFPLSCNKYPDDPHYLSVLEPEARAIVARLHDHPCIALWCGGNELFCNWSKMDDQSLALRTLNAVCLEMSPEIPYNPTSPLNGMGHGCYLFDWGGSNVFEWMDKAHFTAYTEFGIPGTANKEVLQSIIPAEELFPATDTKAWTAHHAFKAWDGTDTWLDETTLTKYFGKAKDLDELILNSQTLQCIGYKLIYEEARRQKPYCAMALNWCYNEPWPAAANNSLLTWPAVPKPALDAVAQSCRPLCASLEVDKFQWKKGENFKCRIWLLNDSFTNAGESYTLSACAVVDGKSIPVTFDSNSSWNTGALENNTNVKGPEGTFAIPNTSSRFITLRVSVEGHPEMDSEYTCSIAQ